MARQSSTPTKSQFASATMHLEQPIQHIRIDGVRYAIVTSGNSDRVYWLPADGSACDERCIWWSTTRTMCSHLLALELSVTLDELADEYVVGSATLAAAGYAFCASAGCNGVVERSGERCDDCAALKERADRLAAGRAKVLAEVAS